ncbi:hypothetical protein HZB03_04980 [Candidatus Woesearchaeota archaeon]|nr:hypothetical protein [Candidatus Woesearchaeota archaeon]
MANSSVNVVYSVHQPEKWVSLPEEDRLSYNFTCGLLIQQPKLDLPKAAAILKNVLASHVLDYSAAKKEFSIYYRYYSGVDGVATVKGSEVLEKLCVQPTEAAVYRRLPFLIAGGYRYRVSM